ncbi:MAG: MBL fold hydrolase [Alphaproteobacteria bacterium CG_4_9_14_3_um_filter_47_13]|nr:MAG: MBL fold hydrolase [Alphaproteobacteria bacterium CG_4_9_14_3_um_filter_47_13]
MAKSKNDLDLNPDDLHFIPLGGSEQFGVNFNIYAYKGKWIGIDLGIGFAGPELPGVDILLPDPAFLVERREDLVALIVTHAHEDHVGAIPYIWPRLRCPVYCTKFTAAVLRRKLREAPDCRDMEIRVVAPGDKVTIGPFEAHFIHVAHSIPETCAVILETPEGRVVHSGDWNLDPAPVIGLQTDEKSLSQAGNDGVLAYIGDSTNSNVDGRARSESDVETGLDAVFKDCRGRIVVTCFSSNIARIQSICKAAQANGRSVAVVGRSLHHMVGAAKECGYLNDLPRFLEEEEIGDIAADQQVYIVTGSQGEGRAALGKIAHGQMRHIRIGKGDTVIFSARPIPGNEKDIDALKNVLIGAGIEVIGSKDTSHIIHVSGHPCRDEVADMYRWVRPELVIPVHGERLQIEAQADLARKCQVKQVIVPHNGSVIRLKKGGSEIIDHVATGLLALEGKRLIPTDHPAIRERRKLQYTGSVHVSIVLDGRGDLVCDPQVTTVGLIDQEDKLEKRLEEDILDEIEDILADMQREDRRNDHAVQEEIRIGIRRMLNIVTGMKPKTSVHTLRV